VRGKTQLRIVSGVLGGRIIDTPANRGVTQPMGERERMAIFNQIRPYLPDTKVLDAFAGSGALGITALSNGAASADFLENNSKAIKTINANIHKLKLEKTARTIQRVTGEYDIIFADPPYDNPQYGRIDTLVSHLKEGGYLILSHPGEPEPPEFIGLALLSDRSYAAAHIKIYQKI
jgi:16S rRNA (guanine966-N2)-methyltransferase